ncbi:flagellin [Vreelandella aquamarina]|uniref:flagellin N-terminal helical domain-containing protein n=1 Tax=Vreelandella aquamarina TaxID=77097 RepID=UPI003D041C9D
MSVINTNITSMIGQQNLSKSQSALTTSMERLSSGLRINSAKDDAAGQAIANRMSAQITGLAQSQRNANDGISISQTAEGALNQVNDNLQRVRELAVQAQNGTNSQDDLTSIQDEIGQRLAEIDRISGETNFNGTKVLASDQGIKIQVGANDGEAITVNLQEINAETLGLGTFNVDGNAQIQNTAVTTEDLDAYIENNDFPNGQVTAGGELDDFDYLLSQNNDSASAANVLNRLGEGDTATAGSDATEYGFASGTVNGSTFTADGNGNFTFDVDGFEVIDTGTPNTFNSSARDLLLGSSDGEMTQINYEFTGEVDRDLFVDSSGAIFDGEGNRMRMVTDGTSGEYTGQLTADTGGSSVELTADVLMSFASGVADPSDNTGGSGGYAPGAGDATIEILNGDNAGRTITSTADATTVDISGATITAEELATFSNDNDNAIAFDLDSSEFGEPEGTAITLGIDADGVVSVTNNNGITEIDAAAVTMSAAVDGQLSTSATAETELYVRDSGDEQIITDGGRNQFFFDQDNRITTDEFTTGERTEDPLAALDAALNNVDSLRSELGAVQNRFESAITNLSTNETNLSAARSRIEDADYAVEVANMTRAQILQQAGTSVLAQANQIPQNVLSLLG